MPSPSARHTECAIISSSSVRMTRTATRLAAAEIAAALDPAEAGERGRPGARGPGGRLRQRAIHEHLADARRGIAGQHNVMPLAVVDHRRVPPNAVRLHQQHVLVHPENELVAAAKDPRD